MNHGRKMLLLVSVIFGGLTGCTAVDYPDDNDNTAYTSQTTVVTDTATERLKKGERDAPLSDEVVAKQQETMGTLDPVVVPPGLEKNAAVSTD